MAIAREIATFLTIARTDALLSGHETLTVIDGEHRTITSANQVLTLPADVSLAVLSAESCRRSETSVGVLFRRDGSSCGAVIRIARPGGQGLRIRVNWYTGHIEILSA
jgi:general secretion pathway protein H